MYQIGEVVQLDSVPWKIVSKSTYHLKERKVVMFLLVDSVGRELHLSESELNRNIINETF